MYKSFLVAGALLGGLGVALGAFGAHGLQKLTSDPATIHGFQTGVQYQVYHALALLGVGILFEKVPTRFLKWAGHCFIAGTVLFSGSLYILTLSKVQELGITKFVGPITPLGGVFFILGWVFLLIGVSRKRS